MDFSRRQLAALVVSVSSLCSLSAPALARPQNAPPTDLAVSTRTQFGQQEVDDSRFIAIAAPIGQSNGYNLLILEQIDNTQPCWSERGNSPTLVEPLLRDFDFTGICNRSTDSNGYSMRVGQQDFGLQYTLQVRERDRELVLMAIPIPGYRNLPRVEIGRTRGLVRGKFVRIYLNPGWRLTRRTYEGQSLGHIYLTHDLSLAQLGGQPRPNAAPTPPAPIETEPVALPASSPDNEVPTIEFGDTPQVTPAPTDALPPLNPPATIEPEVEETLILPRSPRESFRNSPLPVLEAEDGQ